MAGNLRISVCMAAYNGQRFITAQLRSILSQISEQDEVVVVDDGSTDETKARIRDLADERIRLIEHPRALGILRTFEDAIRSATHDIIFLSDQDDVWLPNKASTILQAFRDHPGVSLVASAVRFVDSEGVPLREVDCDPEPRFSSGFWSNLMRNRYRGCTMAFRAEIRSEILPLPRQYDVLHDVWIGMRNRLSGGKTLYIEEPLMLYRRHAATMTGRNPLSLGRKVKIRLHLLRALAHYSIKKRFGAV